MGERFATLPPPLLRLFLLCFRPTPSLPPSCGRRRSRSTLSLSLPDIFSSARANLVCVVMIAMSGLAQNPEQLAWFPALRAHTNSLGMCPNAHTSSKLTSKTFSIDALAGCLKCHHWQSLARVRQWKGPGRSPSAVITGLWRVFDYFHTLQDTAGTLRCVGRKGQVHHVSGSTGRQQDLLEMIRFYATIHPFGAE